MGQEVVIFRRPKSERSDHYLKIKEERSIRLVTFYLKKKKNKAGRPKRGKTDSFLKGL
jgi:hypothetical protein